MFDNDLKFENMHSKFAKSAYMTLTNDFSITLGRKTTLNFKLILNSLKWASINVPEKLLCKKTMRIMRFFILHFFWCFSFIAFRKNFYPYQLIWNQHKILLLWYPIFLFLRTFLLILALFPLFNVKACSKYEIFSYIFQNVKAYFSANTNQFESQLVFKNLKVPVVHQEYEVC